MVMDIYVPMSLAWSVSQDDDERHSLVGLHRSCYLFRTSASPSSLPDSHQCFISQFTPNGPMAEEALLDKISNLSDLELAALLCLTNEEHCIIDTDPDSVQDLVHELRLVSLHFNSVISVSNMSIDCL